VRKYSDLQNRSTADIKKQFFSLIEPSFIITKVNYVLQAELTLVYFREKIQSLRAIIDRHIPKGKRDHAIILPVNRPG
jgi:hypothetical protein